MSNSAWGDETEFFFELTPDRVLSAVEASGIRCTGLCIPLNSMENRVYEVEIDTDEEVAHRIEKARVVKFYRPGRWSKEQILEEHEFLLDLQKVEIPVIAPLKFQDGTTLRRVDGNGIWYAIFPKVGGRSPEELTDEQTEQVGRLLARIHNVGATKQASHRIEITPANYAISSLEYLLENDRIPPENRKQYEASVRQICEMVEPWFETEKFQRVHGDCHFGNLLWSREGPFFLDFDDMVRGPCVQDLWLVVPGRDEVAREQFNRLLTAYEQMREFDRRTLRLIEPLRALRFVHFAGWIARRWDDPAFPRAFPDFGTGRFWDLQIQDLREQQQLIAEIQYGLSH